MISDIAQFKTLARAIAAILILLVASSCGNREAHKLMDTAETVMWARPDSALAALESIDTMSLRTAPQRARYSLLYTMALNRNWIDTTDLRVIRPAAEYYERHGSNDYKMKMFYYLGTVQHNCGDLETAVASYMRAKEYSLHSDNLTFKGIISSTISDVYLQNHNYPEALSYAIQAISQFDEAGDSSRLWRSTGMAASISMNMGNYSKADSLFAEFFSFCRDSAYYARRLMDKALLELWRPNPKPEESMKMFLMAVNDFNGSPDLGDYCAYAYALELTGDRKSADYVISQLKAQGCPMEEMDIWLYRIFRHRGDYKEALSMLERSVRERDSTVLSTVGQSVALAQSDYYEDKSTLLEKDRRIQVLIKWVALLLSLMVALSVLWVYYVRKRRWQSQFEEMSSVNDEVTRRLDEALMCEFGKEQMILNLRRKYVEANKQQYQQLNNLCHLYLEGKGSKNEIFAEVKKILAIFDETNQKELESMLDDNLDGIMRKLRTALPDLTDKDFRFISFMILGFDAKTVARVMGYTVTTVYSKRYVLKNRMQNLEVEDKDLVSAFMS